MNTVAGSGITEQVIARPTQDLRDLLVQLRSQLHTGLADTPDAFKAPARARVLEASVAKITAALEPGGICDALDSRIVSGIKAQGGDREPD